ncbi:fibronectin type III domain-containing protein [Lactococcus lactis]|uniref:fibronectin type III domain-containing protein n=1 Tax=Lactococcus lactis TaxID=1358 RepID=UPI002415FE07|nr:fibronectin type III domain-containing protein [Lactococcus lactis]MDG4970066.1 fibronectin type III domain-containing protein [Lactococcus lactis]MDG5103937.1 fibronectin type III domain-containing protein [Lactococcus lactis]
MVTGVKKPNGDIKISYEAPLGAVAYLIHYADANETDPHNARYMGYSETIEFTLAAADIPVGATTGDKIPFWVQAYGVLAPSGTTNVEKAAALHDADVEGSAWSTPVVEVTI